MLFELKGRDKSKRIAIMVPTWDDLAYESNLTSSQINFLKTYKFPFTIISTVKSDFRDEYPIFDEFEYTTVGFRVAETCLPAEAMQHIRYPLFLTSANKTGKGECFTLEEVREVFPDDIEQLKIIPGQAGHQPSSNVIQFA
jgi:tRNA A37 threonylcarbamoyladenosine synthetase subunit TsaC/SUA5/YrdC